MGRIALVVLQFLKVNRVNFRKLLALTFLIALLSLLEFPIRAQQNAATQAPSTPGYAGAEACEDCHASEYESWSKSRHRATSINTRGGPARQGCEACHGPGADHVANPADTTKLFLFSKATPKAVNAQCLSCHASGTQQQHVINSLHSRNDISCTSCHSAHHSETRQFLLVKSQPELCYGCHQQQRPQFSMPFRHRVNEGLIQCSDCHNPHGTERPHQLRTSVTEDQVCYNCHIDKRGPFVYEHEPVRTEGCESCHMPHGSPNVHLLKMSNVNLLCLSCHTTSFANAPGAPSFHNQATQFQACTLCHTAVHGSNTSFVFFK
jgi:DmsE family decaheme c-type cytochrome